MSFTNILISWSKSLQYISNEREKETEWKRGESEEKEREAKRKWMGKDGECK